jgi:hypothetical protein
MKLLTQRLVLVKLKTSLRTFYGRHHDLVYRYGIYVWQMTTVAISTYYHWCCECESRSGRGVQHYVIKFVSDLRQLGGLCLTMFYGGVILDFLSKQQQKHIFCRWHSKEASRELWFHMAQWFTWMVGSSGSTSGIRRVYLVTNLVISYHRGHLWHRYSISVNQVMVVTVKCSKWCLQLNQ